MEVEVFVELKKSVFSKGLRIYWNILIFIHFFLLSFTRKQVQS